MSVSFARRVETVLPVILAAPDSVAARRAADGLLAAARRVRGPEGGQALLTVADVARRWGVAEETVRRKARAGALRPVRGMRPFRFRADVVEDFERGRGARAG